MPFPSTLSTFTRPNATDKLNSPSHSSVHTAMASIVGQIEAVIGQSGDNSVLGTIIGDLRSPDSGGGGHVQTANKGGTGQTAYTKGDILVATSASVIAKLAVGLDGQAVVADSSVAAGLKWGTAAGTRIGATASVQTVITTVAERSIMSVTVPGSTLGTANAIRATLYIQQYQTRGGGSVLLRANYGNNTVASVVIGSDGGSHDFGTGKFEYVLLANGNVALQRGNILVDLAQNYPVMHSHASVLMARSFQTGTSSVESTANQTIGMTAQPNDATADYLTIVVNGYTVEKIV